MTTELKNALGRIMAHDFGSHPIGSDERQMRAALEEIREKAATMTNGGAWAAGLASLCLATLKRPAMEQGR